MGISILDYLDETAERVPEKRAFSDPSAEISFGDLVTKTRQVGTVLLHLVKIGEPVALVFEKSVDAICALLGVVRAGGAYSFLDVNQPENRMRSMLESLCPTVVICTRENEEMVRALAKELEIPCLLLEEVLESAETIAIDEAKLAERRNRMVDVQPLYINFTSGSTGTPKGVAVCHRSVMDFIPVFTQVMGITEDSIMGNQAPFDFDVSVKDIYSALYTGATVVIIPRDYFVKPMLLMDYLCDREVSVLIWAVSALCFITTLGGLEYRQPSTIKCIGFSGEVMPIKHLNKFRKYLPNTTFVNLYGPTEITCNCTYYVIPQDAEYDKESVIPIGKSFDNERVFLLDEEDKLIPEEDTERMGELCVAGTCLALGYYHNPEKTAEAFVRNPLQPCFPELIYRTGDLARYDENGDLVYVSRKDFQVKHQGHRIELGEIELTASGIADVERAVCLYRFDKKRIILFYTGTPEVAQIEEEMRKRMPSYMVPNKTLKLDAFPLNKNGKVDRNALKEMM